MKKVNLFISTLSTGGAERVVSNLSLRLPSEYDRTIIMFGSDSKIDYPYNGSIQYLDQETQGNMIEKLSTTFKRIKALRNIKRSEKSTTISFLEYPNLLNAITSKDGKTVLSVRNHMSTKHKAGIKSLFWNASIKYLYNKADLIVSVSQEIKKDLTKNYNIDKNKIKVINNSYDIRLIKDLSNEDLSPEYQRIFEYPVVITAGRLNKQKGQWHLIRAFSKVKKEIPNAKLVILGEGRLESYLKSLAEKLHIENDIHFLGFQQNPYKFIARSRVFVMTSFYEGFPNALAEAMACGIPIVSTDCKSGPREILAPTELDKEEIDYTDTKDRYGILVSVCDGNTHSADKELTLEESMISSSIVRILSDKDQFSYYAEQSRKRIRDYDIKEIIKEWESII